MGILTDSLTIRREQNALPLPIPAYGGTFPVWPNFNYATLAKEGYIGNEIVFACIEELSTSAAEPNIMLRLKGTDEFLHEDHRLLDGDPATSLNLNQPNPFQDRFEFFATLIMHRALAGNAYAHIERNRGGRPTQLWLMRPDRVRIVPDTKKHISHYTYDIGIGDPIRMPVEDVIHWKTRHPLDDYYGLAPLQAGAVRVDIDSFMNLFIKSFFERAGLPAAVLAVKNKMNEDLKREIATRFRNDNRGPANWHGLLVLEATEASFTPMTSNLGAAGLMVPELEAANVRRICALFQVPPEILSLSDSATSYAALVQVQRFFWDNTLSPLYQAIIGPLNLRLTPNYPDVAELAFDFSNVRALREDVDLVHNRARLDVGAGLMSIEEGRALIGLSEELPAGNIFLIPSNMTATQSEEVGEPPEPPPAPPQLAPVSSGDGDIP